MKNELLVDIALNTPHRVNDPKLIRPLQRCETCGESWPCHPALMEMLWGREEAE
jgi:hypothetical protein